MISAQIDMHQPGNKFIIFGLFIELHSLNERGSTVADPDNRQEKHLVEVDEALTRLTKINEQSSKVVEMHFFGGLTFDEIADILKLSQRTVYREWRTAKTWLHHELAEDDR